MEGTIVHEDRVGQLGLVLDRTIEADFPNRVTALAKGRTRCPERARRIEGEPHRRCREIGERGGRTSSRVVAVYATMGIEADENRPGWVDGQVLHKCWGWPSGHHSDIYSGEFSTVVVGVAFLYFDVS